MGFMGEAGNDSYSSLQVADLAKVSLRQLQWWDEQRVVSPRKSPGHGGSGAIRRYSEDDVSRVLRVAQLRKTGISLQQIRKILKQFKWKQGWTSVKVIRKPTIIGDVLVVPLPKES